MNSGLLDLKEFFPVSHLDYLVDDLKAGLNHSFQLGGSRNS